jgi:hypothetical protein
MAALAAIGLVVAGWSDGLVRWLALAVVLTVAPVVLAEVRPRLGRVRPLLPHLVLVVVAGLFLWELVLGRPPATRDHGIHYFQAHILVEDMFPRWSGWNDRINHGYPYGEGYPTLGYLWVSALHLVSGGIVGLRTSYAWGLLGVWALVLWGVWQVAALVYDDVATRFVGETEDGSRAWAGCLGALAWLLDPGDSRQGGWEYLMFHGVWPQALSAALWVASLVLIRRALVRPSPQAIAIAALAIAGGLLAHPFGLLTTAGSLVGWIIVLGVAEDARTLPIGRMRVLVIVHVLGVALAGAGIATFLTAAAEMGRSPASWGVLGELAGRFVLGELFVGPWAWTGVLAVVGVGLALASARSFAWLVAGLVAGMLLLASHESITVLQLDLVTSAFKNLQFSRWAIAIKPLAFALVGPAAVVAVRALARLHAKDSASSPWPRRAFVAALLAPVAATLLPRADVLAPRPIGAIDTLENSGYDDAERSLREALIAEREHTGTLRVAFLRNRMGGATYPLFAIADAGGAVVLDGHVPTVNFVHVVEQRTPAVLQRLGVTHVIHDRPIDDEKDLVAALEPLATHGPYTLARFLPEPVPFAVLSDEEGGVDVVERTSTRVVLDVAPSQPTELTLAWAPSARWAWTVDGEERESVYASVRGGVELLAVAVDRPARVVLEYVRHPREQIAMWISWLAAALVASGLVFTRTLTFAPRLHSPRASRVWRVVVIVGALVVLVLVARRQRAQLAQTWDEYAATIVTDPERDPMPPFLGDLTAERDLEITRTPERYCNGLLGKDPLAGCQESDGGPFVSMVYIDPYLYRCTHFTVAPGGEAEAVLGDPSDELMVVLVRRGDHRGRQLRYELESSARPQGSRTLVTRAELRVRPRADGERARVRLVNNGNEAERICIAAARFGS